MKNQTEKKISLVNIKEIFTSIQGEGPYVGVNQLFIRFCKCNLNCNYCDTDFKGKILFSPELLWENIKNKLNTVHSISLTGGEPLLFSDFLCEFLPLVNKPVYLETNATLPQELTKILPYLTIISADIKLPSATGIDNLWQRHDEFFKTALGKEIFAKIVFNEKITEEEIERCIELANKYDIELILQPQTVNDKPAVTAEFAGQILRLFLEKYKKVRLIPQVHKFLGVE